MKSWKSHIFIDLMFSKQVNIFFFKIPINFSVHRCLQLFDIYHRSLEELDFITDLIFIPIIKLYSLAFSVWKAFMGDPLRWGGNEVTGYVFERHVSVLLFQRNLHSSSNLREVIFRVETDSGNTSSMGWDRPRRNCLYRTRGLWDPPRGKIQSYTHKLSSHGTGNEFCM